MIEKKVVKKKTKERKEKEKNLGGRPSKIKGFLEGFEKVVNNNINAIILTDEELFILSNEELEEKDQICYATFKNYKASTNKEESELYLKFLALYKKALVRQKKDLFEKLEGNEGQWQKYAWIIERKFSDWNLRHIGEQKNINVDVTEEISSEQKKLIADRFRTL